MLPISVHTLAWNSETTIARALESVRACAEKLVIDGGSTDHTLAIAREHGATVIPQRPALQQGEPLFDFATARNEGLKQTRQPWILSLDSDEYASPELMAELERIVTENTEPSAYFVPRRYVMDDGTVVMHATTYPNERLYFFHRDAVTQWIKPVHEKPEIKPGIPIKHLAGASLAPLGTVADYKEKNLRYLAIEVEKSKGKGWLHWLIHRVLRTLRSRMIALVRLAWIWLLPHRGKRLPLEQEWARFWYAGKLIIATMPS